MIYFNLSILNACRVVVLCSNIKFLCGRVVLGVKGVKFVESSISPKKCMQIGLPMCLYSCYVMDANIVNQSVQLLTLHFYKNKKIK